MAKINVCNVVVLDNPSSFGNPFQFEITFDCFENLPDDLEWKLIYVGSAATVEYDQVLDSVLVGPVPEGRHMFVFQADPPNIAKIPTAEVVGVTVVMLTCSYRAQEFVKIGYFVSNDYEDPELKDNPPAEPIFDKLKRSIIANEARVTVYAIKWGDEPEEEPPSDDGDLADATDSDSVVVLNGKPHDGVVQNGSGLSLENLDLGGENFHSGARAFMSQAPAANFGIPLAESSAARQNGGLEAVPQVNGEVKDSMPNGTLNHQG